MDTVPAFWRVYGGSLLVVAALGVLTLFNSLTAELAELRRGVAREQEARAELVTTTEFEAVMADQDASLRAVEDAFGNRAELPASPIAPDASGS
ncbi:MAG: hypothetical protein JWO38_8312 [Gemmataceae bacterium]|nr:hypothetical protein [Gemmataceae bacterium]